LLCALACGCTGPREYIRNGFKVGPNYRRPPAPVARQWIDADDVRVRSQTEDLSQWWTVFHDPVLDSLICLAYNQNLSLRTAGFRVLEARAQLLINIGNIFPQLQSATGSYTVTGISEETANRTFSGAFNRWFPQWQYNFNMAWELDFWGRFRRAVESDSAALDASVENYDDVLVTLLGEVASAYVQFRTFEQRIKYAQENVRLQERTVNITKGKAKAGLEADLDYIQARSTLEQTQATIPELEIGLRTAGNQLCILLGIPPEELRKRLGPGSIPTAGTDVAAGIPADLLRRRPDVRRAERQAAAQCAQIGVAESELYPHISFTGTFGYSASSFNRLWQEPALNGSCGPTFTWNILNYGRIYNNVRLQDARFQELVTTYQNTVLSAAQDVENGLATFLRGQDRANYQQSCVNDAAEAARMTTKLYEGGVIDLTRVTLLQQQLVTQQDTLAQAKGEIALGLIQVYRALGGGWEIRRTGCQPGPLPPTPPERELEVLPRPKEATLLPRPSETNPLPQGPASLPDPGADNDAHILILPQMPVLVQQGR
jgi:NodT family efflux transporter outer membrane factor (OMF) lipoprotein